MKCEKCNKEATVFFTEIKQDEKKEIHLCAKCAESYQNYIADPHITHSISDFLGGLLQIFASKEQTELKETSKDVCSDCGMSIHEFHASGRLGCERDYRVFRSDIKDLLLKIHGKSRHRGKVPHSLQKWKDLVDLRKRLNSVINQEKYEEAAEIRDKIKQLESAHEA